ncbi:tryptophan halogenase family protein [Colwellia echini]|uniref:Tryptophan 7-halogenase n=1 Tax=Colwellia echini TaxID=1982103 RepID=A0ABY3N1I1_9GAMM|nr:tryptophan halogenase family protein [Colwellia echini]TYK67226.1 tryptophan 7-halogenase [Colwellia echini]
MDNLIKSIIIVGGGTAGWLTAGIIAARHRTRIKNNTLTITVIESDNIPTVGVGEGTWPTMPNTLRSMGISETDFIRECSASFKQGTKFVNWDNETEDSHYYHPFDVPQGALEGDIASFWLNKNFDESLAKLFTSQESICDNELAPKTISTPEYASFANYGYHLDAVKFSAFLSKHCIANLGVKHVIADIKKAELSASGDIASVIIADGSNLSADFFVDCSGFKSLLLGEALGVKFNPIDDVLFADTALAVQVPYEKSNDTIASYTKSTAQTAGWIWDIGLPSRRGVGYVFSSKHASVDEVKKDLVTYIKNTGVNTDELTFREIKFQPGYREKFFYKNCVAIGLSAGFLEPLEASALVMVELSATMIAEQLPKTTDTLAIIEQRFNETFHYRWERVIEFLKLHYIVSNRTTPFWQDNKKEESIPKRLQDQMTLWKNTVPTQFDFNRIGEVFQAASYQFVLYGSKFRTESLFDIDPAIKNFATEQITKNELRTKKLLTTLPSNRELIEQIHQYGMKKI